MESLENTEWDVVIAGTGLAESLLALSLSRSDKKVLHLDRNPYYGGDEAALSLDDAEEWALQHSGAGTSRFQHASIWRPSLEAVETSSVDLASSRAYALALGPQLVYAVSKLVSSLVSSQTSGQLEFQAVGSWFILEQSGEDTAASLTKVPNGREDVFSDKTLDLRAKRSLMKFLRFVATYEEQPDQWEEVKNLAFSTALEQEFGLPASSHGPLLALALSSESPEQTLFADAVPAVARHLRSIGVFGPGFGAVVPKWGGLAEITQVACRACAVGGGVYVLNKSWQSTTLDESGENILMLSGNEKVRSKLIVRQQPASDSSERIFAHSISIVSGTLASLFPLTSEGGVTPAAAVIVVPSSTTGISPVYIQAHSSEAGECPSSQCVLYASSKMSENEDFDVACRRLENAVKGLLQGVDRQSLTLWRLQYLRAQAAKSLQSSQATVGNMVEVPSLDDPVVFEDSLLDGVKEAWKTITGEDERNFLTFVPREGILDED